MKIFITKGDPMGTITTIREKRAAAKKYAKTVTMGAELVSSIKSELGDEGFTAIADQAVVGYVLTRLKEEAEMTPQMRVAIEAIDTYLSDTAPDVVGMIEEMIKPKEEEKEGK